MEQTLQQTRSTESKTVEIRKLDLANHSIELEVDSGLFIPNATTRLFSKAITIKPGDVIFDIGTGVGPLAIWAAAQGSRHVFAVDPVAAHCLLAKSNSFRNHYQEVITILCGNYMNPIPEAIRADVIIADVSGIAERPAKILGWYPDAVPTGGQSGSEVILEMIIRSKSRLTKDGRLYFPVAIELSDSQKIMECARAHYRKITKKVDVSFPIPEAAIPFLKELGVSRKHLIGKRGSRYIWTGQIFEAQDPIGEIIV